MLFSQLDSYKMDISSIQEIRWIGEGIPRMGFENALQVVERVRTISCAQIIAE